MQAPLVMREFPDFDNVGAVAAIRTLYPALRDTSYRHDACPSLRDGDVLVYVDYSAPERREFADAKTFTLLLVGPTDDVIEFAATDKLADALRTLSALI